MKVFKTEEAAGRNGQIVRLAVPTSGKAIKPPAWDSDHAIDYWRTWYFGRHAVRNRQRVEQCRFGNLLS
jgi:hypothetical protein